jgi:hypothetical protein
MSRSLRSPEGKARARRLVSILVANLLLVVLLAIAAEAAAFLLFRFPVGARMLRASRGYYLEAVRRNLQFIPGCARYDAEVSYTLEPAECQQTSFEYSVTVRANRAGLRDDESSLDRPDVIVIGDSHAMGWGVRQEETFAAVLERATGYRTLNMGMPSYGTAREMIALQRVDRSAMKYLIVQYCSNDYEENRAFLDRGNRLPVMREADYLRYQRRFGLERRGYYPGKHLREFLPGMVREYVGRSPWETDPWIGSRDFEQEARAFLAVLLGSGIDLRAAHLLVVEVESYNHNAGGFPAAVQEEVRRLEEATPKPLPAITPIDLAPVLTEQHYYRLDDHMNARGHEAVAGVLLPHLELPGARPAGTAMGAGTATR